MLELWLKGHHRLYSGIFRYGILIHRSEMRDIPVHSKSAFKDPGFPAFETEIPTNVEKNL